MPASLLLRLSEGAGPFIKSLDLTGHTHLLSGTLTRVTDELCMKSAMLSSVGHAQITTVNLKGCTALTTRALHHLLVRCPALQTLCLIGLPIVKNATCDLFYAHCPRLMSLDVSGCVNVDGEGIWSWMDSAVTQGVALPLKELRMSGLKYVTDGVMTMLGKAAPHLEVLDLSYVRGLHNSSLEAFVACDEDIHGLETVVLTSREAGRDPLDSTRYRRRITRLRHLSLSSCILLTDIACSNLAHAVPWLEFLELAGIGAAMRDTGVVHLLGTTPLIRRLDLEEASEITDAVLTSLTPGVVPVDGAAPPPEPGQVLEHLVISYASNVTDDALLALIRACTRLKVLEADNTRMSGAVLKEFVKLARKRGVVNARVVAIDCRGVGESAVKDLAGWTRPRLGWRAYDAKKLAYVDGRDGEELKVGQDECDEHKVVVKSFYSWQTVDAVRAAREKRRKSTSRRNNETGSASESEEVLLTTGRARWWSPSGRSGRASPSNTMDHQNREGCRIM
jgi:F-box and leucine-rich repeat protein 2/20